jgi:hypothetical protein
MKFRPILAAGLTLLGGAAYSQSDENEPPTPNPAVEIPLSSFEAIQPPPPAGLPSIDPATPPAPLRLQIDPNLTSTGPAAPPPPFVPAPQPAAPPPPPPPEEQ